MFVSFMKTFSWKEQRSWYVRKCLLADKSELKPQFHECLQIRAPKRWIKWVQRKYLISTKEFSCKHPHIKKFQRADCDCESLFQAAKASLSHKSSQRKCTFFARKICEFATCGFAKGLCFRTKCGAKRVHYRCEGLCEREPFAQIKETFAT